MPSSPRPLEPWFSQSWLSPLIHLSNNWISRIGIVLVTTATIFWLFLLPATLRGEAENPYIGILTFLGLPSVFVLGLILAPVGIALRRRREHSRGTMASEFPPPNFSNPEFRKLLLFLGVATFANIVIAAQTTYSAVNYMDSVNFCGLTCHTVMKPEFTAYQGSPHARVECVKCHIGPGASWFVKSKLSGVGQVIAVTFHTYARPIPTPVRNLRPARETCETCHWPEMFGGDRLRVVSKFGDDENNSPSKTVLLMHIGGANAGKGIHGTHMGRGVRIRYAQSDEKRQAVPWVEYAGGDGKTTTYKAADVKGDLPGNLPVREMDCVDCHNRPTHVFETPDVAVDWALAAGNISTALPFAKKTAVEILKKPYSSAQQAAMQIPAQWEAFYRDQQAATYQQHRTEVTQAGTTVLAIFNRNVFPEMNITWGSYPNNIGHNEFPGCFRCHDDAHAAADGKKISQDCNACHGMLAMEEKDPKILTDLGLAGK